MPIIALLSAWATSPAQAAHGEPALPDTVVMTVAGVTPAPDGAHLVFLVDPQEERVLPITVGSTEALTISLRSQRKRFDRPLTHDVLDGVLHHLKGRIVRVQIDDLQDRAFTATVTLKRRRQQVELDARASDAIAIALGHKIPIEVARHVLDAAALDRAELIESIASEGDAAVDRL